MFKRAKASAIESGNPSEMHGFIKPPTSHAEVQSAQRGAVALRNVRRIATYSPTQLLSRAAVAGHGGKRRAVGAVAGNLVVLERLHATAIGLAYAGSVAHEGRIAQQHIGAATICSNIPV